MAIDFKAIAANAVASDDLTKVQSFEREVPRKGVALLRLLSYIETGKHLNPKEPSYKPGLKCELVFELHHPDHLIEIQGKKVPQLIYVRLNKGTTAKSGYKKLFNVMNEACGGTKQHFVEMIGEAFLGRVYHNEGKEGADGKKPIYANLDKDGAWSLTAPQQEDAITGEVKKIKIPPLQGTPRVFLWENATVSDEQIRQMWDSIYIEGESERTVNGQTVKKSKNVYQEACLAAVDYQGSRLQSIIETPVDLDGAAAPEYTPEPDDEEDDIPY